MPARGLIACLAISAGLAGVTPHARAAGTPGEGAREYRLGFISSLTGTFEAAAGAQRKGVQLAVEERNAGGGLDMPWGKVKVTLIVKDDEARLDVGVRRFRELVGEGANALVGTSWNPMAAAIGEELERTPLPFVATCFPALDSLGKGDPARRVFYVTLTPWSIGYVSGAVLVEQMGKRRIFYVSRSDPWGRTIHQGLQAALKEHGGEIVGFAEYPPGATDFSAAIGSAIAATPDALVASQSGADAIALFEQAHARGLSEHATMFDAFMTRSAARKVPPRVLQDLHTLTFFHDDADGFEDGAVAARARAYSDRYRKAFGEPPGGYATTAYMAARMTLDAVEKARTFDPAAVARSLRETSFDTVRGPARFRADGELVGKYLAFVVAGKAPAQRKEPGDLFRIVGYYGGDRALPPPRSPGR